MFVFVLIFMIFYFFYRVQRTGISLYWLQFLNVLTTDFEGLLWYPVIFTGSLQGRISTQGVPCNVYRERVCSAWIGRKDACIHNFENLSVLHWFDFCKNFILKRALFNHGCKPQGCEWWAFDYTYMYQYMLENSPPFGITVILWSCSMDRNFSIVFPFLHNGVELFVKSRNAIISCNCKFTKK